MTSNSSILSTLTATDQKRQRRDGDPDIHIDPQKDQDPHRLPQEVVREVFNHLLKPRNKLQLDLLASSMVCTTWYYEARALLDDRSLCFHYTCTGRDLRRAAELLAKSRHLGLDYSDLIHRIEIYLELFDVSRRDSTRGEVDDALVAIFALRLPNLTKLDIVFGGTFITKSPFIQRIRAFLDHIVPTCTAITTIRLHGGNYCGYYYTTPRPLAVLVEGVSRHLQVLNLSEVSFHADMHVALRACTNIREITLNEMLVDDLVQVLSAWPDLRRFHYTLGADRDLHIGDVIIALGSSCPRLNEFMLSAVRRWDLKDVVSTEALYNLLERCPELKSFHIICRFTAPDPFIAGLIRRGRALENIVLEGWWDTTAEAVAMEERDSSMVGSAVVGTWWPELQSLSLDGYHRVSRSFVRRVLESCPKLATLKLAEKIDIEEGWRQLLGEFEFEFEHNEKKWLRR